MSVIKDGLEQLLKPYLHQNERDTLDLYDESCPYRDIFLDILSEKDTKSALCLYPNGEILYGKYLEICKYQQKQANASKDEIENVVKSYTNQYKELLLEYSYNEAANFIDRIVSIEPVAHTPEFNVGENIIHRYIYGCIGEVVIDDMPACESIDLLYNWSLKKTGWITVTAYFLETFFNEDAIPSRQPNYFEPAFKLWCYRYSNKYWAKGNDLLSSELCFMYNDD
ncbi:hypothetical protein [Thaumasiovibrio subtropicus]|uniref:hypothetical protein n=1 Tax=Thaumasiovibrio subtropicus TaxID=1891207 RepID=UPI001C84E165|nr:hypothetical protein [Thaumasiovibrio subtropicus]